MTATTQDSLRAAPRARTRSLTLPRPELVALLVLAGALNLWALSTNGWANEYYSGAVRSMAASWHAFLYGSLDVAGVMTVDKPPLALMVQALSVRVFGWSSWSMLVPQALMGVASVGLGVRPRRAPLRARGRVRRRRRAGADADRGRRLAPQQPGCAARPVRRRRAVGGRARARGRARALDGARGRVRRARLLDQDGRGAAGRAGADRRVGLGGAGSSCARTARRRCSRWWSPVGPGRCWSR